MKIKWLGHAAFRITSSEGTSIVTDPYQPGSFGGQLRYGPIEEPADLVLVTHPHADHAYPQGVPGQPQVITAPGVYSVNSVEVKGVPTAHDPQGGRLRGANVIFRFVVDGISLCHLGDLGHMLTDEQAAAVTPLDVLLTPVGGTFTVDAAGAAAIVNRLRPRLTIPMHYRTAKCSFNITGVEPFIAGKPNVKEVHASEVELTPETLPDGEIWVLEPAL